MKNYAMWLMFFLLGFTTNLAFNNSKEDKLKDSEIIKLRKEIEEKKEDLKFYKEQNTTLEQYLEMQSKDCINKMTEISKALTEKLNKQK